MINKKIFNIGLIGYGVVGKRRIKNLPNNFRLIGCADPINSTKNILRSPAWQPGDDKAAFEDSIKSTGGFITSSVVEVNQLKNNLHHLVKISLEK